MDVAVALPTCSSHKFLEDTSTINDHVLTQAYCDSKFQLESEIFLKQHRENTVVQIKDKYRVCRVPNEEDNEDRSNDTVLARNESLSSVPMICEDDDDCSWKRYPKLKLHGACDIQHINFASPSSLPLPESYPTGHENDRLISCSSNSTYNTVSPKCVKNDAHLLLKPTVRRGKVMNHVNSATNVSVDPNSHSQLSITSEEPIHNSKSQKLHVDYSKSFHVQHHHGYISQNNQADVASELLRKISAKQELSAMGLNERRLFQDRLCFNAHRNNFKQTVQGRDTNREYRHSNGDGHGQSDKLQQAVQDMHLQQQQLSSLHNTAGNRSYVCTQDSASANTTSMTEATLRMHFDEVDLMRVYLFCAPSKGMKNRQSFFSTRQDFDLKKTVFLMDVLLLCLYLGNDEVLQVLQNHVCL